MNEQQPVVSLTFEHLFRFESSGSIEDVAHAVKLLAQKSEPAHISLSPIPHGHSFHYEIRRFDKNSRLCTTAVADGKIWQRANGTVIVQGTAQIEPWGFYGALVVSALLCLTTAISMIDYALLFGLLFFALASGIAFLYYGDRNRLMANLSQIAQSSKKARTSAL